MNTQPLLLAQLNASILPICYQLPKSVRRNQRNRNTFPQVKHLTGIIRWFPIPGKDNELARKWNYNQDYEFKWEKGCQSRNRDSVRKTRKTLCFFTVFFFICLYNVIEKENRRLIGRIIRERTIDIECNKMTIKLIVYLKIRKLVVSFNLFNKDSSYKRCSKEQLRDRIILRGGNLLLWLLMFLRLLLCFMLLFLWLLLLRFLFF